jgi:hypothetical protein
MHVETTYTPEKAKDIFDLTKGFMKKIASRMDENGILWLKAGQFFNSVPLFPSVVIFYVLKISQRQ